MPAQKTKSPVSLKLSDEARRKLVQHKDDEVKVDVSGNLPAGIEGGTAQLVDAKVGAYQSGANEGKPFLYLAGTVISPVAAPNGQRVQGQRTSQTLPLCATGTGDKAKSDVDNILSAMNEMKALTSQDFLSDLEEDADILAFLKEKASLLKELAPHFKFRTWAFDKDEITQENGKWVVKRKGRKLAGPYASEELLRKANPYAGRDPRTNETWQGAIEANGELNPDAGVVDETGDSPGDQVEEDQTEEQLQEAEANADEGEDLDALGVTADDDSDEEAAKEAEKRLTELAKEHGVAKECKEASNWVEAAEIIQAAMGGSEESTEEAAEEEVAEEAYTPDKGDNIYYRPIDPKTKKPSLKKVSVEVLAVNKKLQTVDLKSLSDKKTVYKAVKWSDLIQE